MYVFIYRTDTDLFLMFDYSWFDYYIRFYINLKRLDDSSKLPSMFLCLFHCYDVLYGKEKQKFGKFFQKILTASVTLVLLHLLKILFNFIFFFKIYWIFVICVDISKVYFFYSFLKPDFEKGSFSLIKLFQSCSLLRGHFIALATC